MTARGLGRGKGSAPAGSAPKVHRSIRVDPELDAAVVARVRSGGGSYASVIEDAIRALVAR